MDYKKEETRPFGWSLLVEVYNCSKGLGNHTDDFYICYKFLDKLPGLIGMNKQAPPIVIETDAVKYPDKAGYSGWVALVESGIQIHTLLPAHFITIDIYSCKKFDPQIALRYINKMFQPFNPKNDIKFKYIKRGEDYSNPADNY